MCGHRSTRHARCGHDISRREEPCIIEESLPGQDLCQQRYDMGMKQDDTFCLNCKRRVVQMYRHGWPDNAMASLVTEIKTKTSASSRSSSFMSTSSEQSVASGSWLTVHPK